jgi:DNA polymerase-2
MQIVTALRRGILVPYQKQQCEAFKTPSQLICADRGGLVGQPQTGLHHQVAEIDFFSMYPKLMQRFNISPETVGKPGPRIERIPGLGTPIDQAATGFVGQALRPLLAKRLALKKQLAALDRQDYRYGLLKARSNALKWLLVVCFGYLGHKHFRWMRVEAYEAVTAFGREILLTAKDIAEEFGFRVLYFNVDGLYIQKEGAMQSSDFQCVVDEVYRRTGMPVFLEGVYRWIAFLPSRMDSRVPVANRYFGVFQDGRIKVRGIEMRRHDTPMFVYQAQAAMLKRLAQVGEGQRLEEALPEVIAFLRERATRLRAGAVPVEDLLVTQRLSRMLHEYKRPSPSARAGMQLEAVGKPMRPGQTVKFLYTRTDPGVSAWQAGQPLYFDTIDVERYVRLLVRAASNILQPFGFEEDVLTDQVAGQLLLFPIYRFKKVDEENRLLSLLPVI